MKLGEDPFRVRSNGLSGKSGRTSDSNWSEVTSTMWPFSEVSFEVSVFVTPVPVPKYTKILI